MNVENSTPGKSKPVYFVEGESMPADTKELIPGTAIQYPSKAYQSACGSYTYRLSELIFGSLLAAYILGFVSFAANSGFFQILQALIISVTFCYLTAAYYVT